MGNLEAKDKAILGSTAKAVLAYSVHLSELTLGRKDGFSLQYKNNVREGTSEMVRDS